MILISKIYSPDINMYTIYYRIDTFRILIMILNFTVLCELIALLLCLSHHSNDQNSSKYSSSPKLHIPHINSIQM